MSLAMSFKIVQKKNHHAVYASGFHIHERAEQWLAKYDKRLWTDKNVTRDDLEIVEDSVR